MANSWTGSKDRAQSCCCIGPQNGEPLCPCQMRGVVKRGDEYVIPERVIGKVQKLAPVLKCAHCQCVVLKGDKYCSYCGKPLGGEHG